MRLKIFPDLAPAILCTRINPSWQIMGALGGKMTNNTTLDQIQVKIGSTATCPQDACKGN